MSTWIRRCYECSWPLGHKEIFCPRCGARQRPERSGRAATPQAHAGTGMQHGTPRPPR